MSISWHDKVDLSWLHKPWECRVAGTFFYASDAECLWLVTAKPDGWFWHTTINGKRSSSLFGPFSSSIAAMADCETAHK